ncbi:alpha/beta hydrolase [Xiashengella succiniciproducens]|uniref:Alpha/beta hydrolase n=1 Tax=Xiashengella succiniciproducens TaxID=2949635 RepID=A0A9J6ZQU7_9BACT|nr:alpha/beta hydrolase [Alkaliflexus sp. Ai-910]URW80324.1 alpha/beta hydrolase [Alkaliflexus sp. Ai-910]
MDAERSLLPVRSRCNGVAISLTKSPYDEHTLNEAHLRGRDFRFGLCTLLLAIFIYFSAFSQEISKETPIYSVKDGQELKMDIYSDDSAGAGLHPCLIFVFGGGFKDGTRDNEIYIDFFRYFVARGYIVASIDYRLGMKDTGAPGIFDTKPLQNAISLAVSDLYSATVYLLDNAGKLGIDSSLILISGSSAGAIAALQADYHLSNLHDIAAELPRDFRYAGVISFAGGVFSKEGVPDYKRGPAPTLFFHGSADKLVPYKQTRFMNLGMFGSHALAKAFRKKGYTYAFYSLKDVGHEAAEFPMSEMIPETESFISLLMLEGRTLMVDIDYIDPTRKPEMKVKPSDYY